MSTATAPPKVTPANYLTDQHLSPGVRDFLKIVNSGGPVEALPKLAARQVLIDAQKAFNVDYSGIEETEKTIEADGFTIKLNIVRPEKAKGALPVFIFVHGGGWILGDYPTHRRLVRDYEHLSATSESRVYWAMTDVMSRRLTRAPAPSWRST